jgi:hypothetical protein
MIELTQFIKWLCRRAWALPGRLHSRLTDSFDDDCFATLFFSSLATFLAGLGVGVVLHGLTGGHVISAILALIIWTTGSVFIVTAGVRAMYRAFRRDQDNVIKRLTE